MNVIVIFLLIGLVIVAVAALCNALLSPRVRSGDTSRGRASAITLVALLVTPAFATLLILVAFEVPAVPLTVYFYGGYAVGLVCFIVLNRRYRDMDRS
jgi:MFS family permease